MEKTRLKLNEVVSLAFAGSSFLLSFSFLSLSAPGLECQQVWIPNKLPDAVGSPRSPPFTLFAFSFCLLPFISLFLFLRSGRIFGMGTKFICRSSLV